VPRSQFMEPIRVTALSITIVLAWAIRASASIQIGTPAAAKGSIPLARSHGLVLSAINPDINPAFLRADQRLYDPRASRQPIGADQDFALSVVDRADRKRCAVLLGSEANSDGCARGHRGGRQGEGKRAEGQR
jgi:hypothetical protein